MVQRVTVIVYEWTRRRRRRWGRRARGRCDVPHFGHARIQM